VANEQLPQTYAQAIFEQATLSWLLPLKEFAKCIEPADMEALDRPGTPFSKKQEILARAMPSNATNEVRNFLSLIASRSEMYLLPNIIQALERMAQHGPLRAIATVTSAIALTDAEKKALEDKMRRRFGQDLAFVYEVDPSILGGVVVRIGDKVIDGSVSGRLAALREKLK
jgi:F-type H+-transporting ATPase subunit delta